MLSRKILRSALLVVLAAGLGVSVSASQPQTTPAKKKPGTTTARSRQKTTGKKASKTSGRRQKGQKTPTPERISEIQSALAKDGSYTSAPTGKWDDGTVAAMRKYQASHGLNPSGKLDALTLHKLGLGSQTAGIAAPLPPTSSSSLLAPTSRIASSRPR